MARIKSGLSSAKWWIADSGPSVPPRISHEIHGAEMAEATSLSDMLGERSYLAADPYTPSLFSADQPAFPRIGLASLLRGDGWPLLAGQASDGNGASFGDAFAASPA